MHNAQLQMLNAQAEPACALDVEVGHCELGIVNWALIA
jgi:hypothetical protein